jgi:glycosyltransferase involved in cell wall biosynthesis
VLMSSTYAAKYPKIDPATLVINYCHTPFRLAWYSDSYSLITRSKGVSKFILKGIVKVLQKLDFKAAQRSDLFIANTVEVAQRIRQVYKYKGEVEVINPPANCDNFYISSTIKDYYLVVCRLESYKKIDLIVECFNQLGLPLIIVGKGSMEEEIKNMAKSNIIFKNSLSSDELAKLYAECKAFVFAQKEDYGITPLEANAAGRPVIAFGQGGVLETMIPYNGDAKVATAVFFNKQTSESLIEAIKEFEKLKFSPDFIRKHAEKFHETLFVEKIRDFVYQKYSEIDNNQQSKDIHQQQKTLISQ